MIDEKRLIEDIEKEFEGVCVYDVTASTAIRDFVEIVDKQPKVGEWIPCSERLPQGCDDAEIEVVVSLYEPYSETVIRESGFALFYPENNMFHSVYGERLDITDIVVAWMHLPPAYKGE